MFIYKLSGSGFESRCCHYFFSSFKIFVLFSSGIIIYSAVFHNFTSLVLVTTSTILFPYLTTFLKEVFKESSLVSNDCFLYLLNRFLANDINPYPLTYCLVFGSIELLCVPQLEKHINSVYYKECQINFDFYLQRSIILISNCYDKFIKRSALSFLQH